MATHETKVATGASPPQMHERVFGNNVEPDELASAGEFIGQFFGMSRVPFAGEPERGSHYSNAEIRETYRSLIRGIAQRPGLFLLTGAAGSGKTCLLRRLCDELRGAGHLVISQDRAGLTLAELMAAIGDSFGIAGASSVIDWLPRLLPAQRGLPPVLLAIDNGEQLGGEAMMDLAALLSLPGSPETSLRILLCTRPEFFSRLDLPFFAGLKAKLAMVCRLEPLSEDDAASYIFHRLRGSGRLGTDLFTPAAINDIVAHAAGVPRRIDLLCLRALLKAALAGEPAVTAAIVANAIAAASPRPYVAPAPRPAARPARHGRSVVASSLVAGTLAASVLAYSFEHWERNAAVTGAAPASLDGGGRKPDGAAPAPAPAAPPPATTVVAAIPPAGAAATIPAPTASGASTEPIGVASRPTEASPVGVIAIAAPAASTLAAAADTDGAAVIVQRAAARIAEGHAADAPGDNVAQTPGPILPAPPSDGELRLGDADTGGPSAQPESAPVPSPAQRAALPPAPPEPPAAATPPRLPDAVLAALIDRGDQLLATGDIAAARLFYRRAVESGSPRAATALGKTYDPVFFRDTRALGIRPDAAAAAQWYRMAADMGDAEAPARLQRLQAFTSRAR